MRRAGELPLAPATELRAEAAPRAEEAPAPQPARLQAGPLQRAGEEAPAPQPARLQAGPLQRAGEEAPAPQPARLQAGPLQRAAQAPALQPARLRRAATPEGRAGSGAVG